ncbi:DUF6777 domain-containing protein [Streptomyces sp. NPDC015414]|uniref:DUF6777 domain-containing protein n=1 Tax=Streptomyces sp. NPDC015414 TaxID=3364957 RepID=UPI0036FB57D6
MSVEPPSSGRPTGPPAGPLSGPSQPPTGPPVPPPPGDGSGPWGGGEGPHRPWWKSVPRVAALTAAVIAVAVLAVVLTRPGTGPSVKGGEVFLQPASQTGPDPFTESTVREAGAPTSPPGSPSASTPTAPSAPAGVVRGVDGGAPGLYSGVRNRPSCDVEKQITALRADPARNRAYAAAAGVRPSDLPAFLRSLTPVTLRADTRVTNHGYRDGRATGFQAVLQAGTAVLVDGHGVPRVRCACGNPLTPPVAQPGTVRLTGDRWASYRPSEVVVVTPARSAVQAFVIYDPRGRDWFRREAGDDTGRQDEHTEAPEDTRPWVPPAGCVSPGTTGTSGRPCPPTPSLGRSPQSPSSSTATPSGPGSRPPSSQAPSQAPSSESPPSEAPSSGHSSEEPPTGTPSSGVPSNPPSSAPSAPGSEPARTAPSEPPAGTRPAA